MKKIKISSGNVKIEAELYDNKTAEAIYGILPITASVNTWGDEIYFEIPIHVELDEGAKEVVSKGELGFWPSGNCFCIFFGKTPMSKGDEIRPASAVNVFGKVIGDTNVLKRISDSVKITVEKC